MWGYIFLETYTNTNYSFSFPSDNAQIVLQLIHWQYWWWFWFTYFIVLYYILFIRLLYGNLLKFSPKLVTSYRAHGKWGDFLVCFIPISWCLNILTNSNFILRMIEWQMETSLITLRVRGKQWYWIYKFEVSNSLSLYNHKKMIGLNFWVYNTNINYSNIYTYLDLIQLQHNSKFLNFYWDSIYLNNLSNWSNLQSVTSNIFLVNPVINYSFIIYNLYNNKWLPLHINITNNNNFLKYFIFTKSKSTFLQNVLVSTYIYEYVDEETQELVQEDYLLFFLKNNLPTFTYLFDVNYNYLWVDQNIFYNNNLLFFCNKIKSVSYNIMSELQFYSTELALSLLSVDFYNQEINRFYKTQSLINNSNLSLIHSSKDSLVFYKNSPHSYSHLYWVLKQKRNIFKKQVLNQLNLSTYSLLNSKNSNNSVLLGSIDPFVQQIISRRLLRTNRILLLPININLTIITNSFDVIHSWYIPGLGIKLDCVPGRSTHHNLNIQSAGFYYGQCAEICGRYHHHMPIRICAVSFQHFLLWWSHFGLTKFFVLNNLEIKKQSVYIF